MTIAEPTTTAALLEGRYLLGDCIGRGGMSTVFRAHDTHLGRDVAIKLIDSDDGAVRGWIDRVHTEKALLSTLNHPSLVTLYDAHLDAGGPRYLVMELVDGPTLASRRVIRALSPRQLAGILQSLAEGLAAVHAAGYVHRDVKPSNVLLAPPEDLTAGEWTAKLADFGIACPVGHEPEISRGVVLGTLAYIAPEQLRGLPPTPAVDVFALGLVALHSLTGSIGYAVLGDDGRPSIHRLTQAPEIPETVDPRWRDLIARMTRLDPAERPTAAEVAREASALRRIVAIDPTSPLTLSIPVADADTRPDHQVPTTRLPRRRRRPRTRLVAASAAAVVAAAAITTGMALGPRDVEAVRAGGGSIQPVGIELAGVQAPEAPTETAPDAQPASLPVDGTRGKGNSAHANPGQGPSDRASDNARGR